METLSITHPATVLEAQIAHADRILEAMRQNVHRELRQRNGKGDPRATDITDSLCGSLPKIVQGISSQSAVLIRMEAIEGLSITLVEAVEFSHYKSA